MNPFVLITPENAGEYFARIIEIENLSFITPWSPEAFRDELRNPLSRILGYTVQGELWGYICFWNSGREIQVMNIAVHPECRRRGTAAFLMELAIRSGVEQKAEVVWLEVRTSNDPARHLYEKLGFQEVGRRPGYYRDTGEDAIVMSLSIPCSRSKINNRSQEV
jgi:ribosomal-protein-alanine N-acetyltransferase